MSTLELELGEGRIGLAELRQLESADTAVFRLGEDARACIARGAAHLRARMEAGGAVYGVNTGVGPLAGSSIPPELIGELQRRLVVSNCAGVGEPLAPRVVQRAMVLKTLRLASGRCGVSRALVDVLVDWLNQGLLPVIPSQGSVGASGDLAPLAHMAAALSGIGEVDFRGRRMPAADAIVAAGLSPVTLGAKEGAALLNGTEISTALAIEGLLRAEECLAAALISGALTVDAGGGTAHAFDARTQALRRQPGQIAVAAAYRSLLEGSELQTLERSRIQDPYCLRCQPQVMGAAMDLLEHAGGVLEREIEAVTDNPLICLDSGELLYGGNFHAQPVGLAADCIAMAVSEIGGIAERRVAYLVDANFSGLPAFLVADGGLNSGFMLAQVTAAALVSENKAIATPGSLDSIPTGANSEDYVSMATYAARRLSPMAANLRSVIAIEILAACQGIDLRRPHRTSDRLEGVWSRVREEVSRWDEDRVLSPDIEAVAAMVRSGELLGEEVLALLPSRRGSMH